LVYLIIISSSFGSRSTYCMMAYFSQVDYWNDRYSKNVDNKPFEWYQRYENIKHILKPEILSPTNTFPPPSQTRVLILGCGNSTLGEDMINDNAAGIIWNIDFSAVAIEQMKQKYQGNAKYENKLKFGVADITNKIPFDDSTFDLIICKATMDAVLTSSSPVANVRKMMEECYRVLDTSNHGGMMVVISSATPENRMVYFEKIWKGGVEVLQIPRPKICGKAQDAGSGSSAFHVYICRKGKDGEDYDMASQLVRVKKV